MFQALDALKTALQQEPSDPAVRAELHFSMGNQLREMNELDRAFQVTSPAAVRVREALFKYSLLTHSCLLGCSLPTDSSWTIWCMSHIKIAKWKALIWLADFFNTESKSIYTGFYQSCEKPETWGLFFVWFIQKCNSYRQ